MGGGGVGGWGRGYSKQIFLLRIQILNKIRGGGGGEAGVGDFFYYESKFKTIQKNSLFLFFWG